MWFPRNAGTTLLYYMKWDSRRLSLNEVGCNEFDIFIEWSLETSNGSCDINVGVSVRETICGHVIRIWYGPVSLWCGTYYLSFSRLFFYVRSRVNTAKINVPQVEHRTTQAFVLFPVSRPNKRVTVPPLLIFTWVVSQVANPWTASTYKKQHVKEFDKNILRCLTQAAIFRHIV